MNPSYPDIERLITRFLDQEATPAERRELRALARRDPTVDALIDEYAALDREVGAAMRGALGRTFVVGTGRSSRRLAGPLAALAVAACLTLVVWLSPGRTNVAPAPNVPARAAVSWFAPGGAPSDAAPADSRAYERPQVRVRDTHRHWIIVPAGRPGEYMVIEINRVCTHAIPIQADF